MQSFMLSSKSAQFLEFMDLRTRTKRQQQVCIARGSEVQRGLQVYPSIPVTMCVSEIFKEYSQTVLKPACVSLTERSCMKQTVAIARSL